jgi:hypothetical protein
MITGDEPKNEGTELEERFPALSKDRVPESYYPALKVINACLCNPEKRANFIDLNRFFSGPNPFEMSSQESEPLFRCGSICSPVFICERNNEYQGYFTPDRIKTEYIGQREIVPTDHYVQRKYSEMYDFWKKQPDISNNNGLSLKGIVCKRDGKLAHMNIYCTENQDNNHHLIVLLGDDEPQQLLLKFGSTRYLHHKAMNSGNNRKFYNLTTFSMEVI